MKDDAPEYIVNNLAYFIKRRGYKMYEVVEATKIPPRTLNDYCRGRTAIPRDRLETLAAFLECSIPALLGETEPTSHESTPLELKRVPTTKKTALLEGGAHAQPAAQVTNEPPVRYNIAIPSLLVVLPASELDTLDIIFSRRQVLQGLLNTACTALTLSPYLPLHSESQERLERAIKNPSRVDRDVLDDLASITGRYWHLCANTSINLLSGISGHFTTVIELLRWPHPTPIHQQLCSLAGENAQILGKTLYDLREYHLAWAYYSFSIKAAEAARNDDLRAVGLGRIALLLMYCGRSSDALPFVQDALQEDLQNARIRAWLACIEAEIYAALVNDDACIRALEISKDLSHEAMKHTDPYATGFNLSRQFGYEGACFVRLQRPEQALPALQAALDTISPTAIRRRATLYADMSYAYAQLEDVKQACSFARQALDITAEVKSISTLQRLQPVKDELEPWKKKTEVRNLKQQFSSTIAALVSVKETI